MDKKVDLPEAAAPLAAERGYRELRQALARGDFEPGARLRCRRGRASRSLLTEGRSPRAVKAEAGRPNA